MTIGDLIKEKDYDYVSYRLTIPGCGNIFAGYFASKDGEILYIDGDNIYDKHDEVLSYEEWSKKDNGIEHGLTVIVKGNWYHGEDK